MSTGWAPSGLSGPLHRLLDHATVGIVAGKTLRPVEYGMRAVVVLMDANLGFDEVRAKPAGRDLQPQALEGHGVVISDNALFLDAQHVLPLREPNRNESAPGLGSSNRETSVVRGQENICDEAVCRFHIGDAGQREFLWQPILKRAEHALAAPARLRRIGGNMLDAELRQPPSHLRQRTRVNFLACLGSEEINGSRDRCRGSVEAPRRRILSPSRGSSRTSPLPPPERPS